MSCDLSHCDPATTAWIFPGQGAHCLSMLDAFRDDPGFPELYEDICTRLGYDPLDAAVERTSRLSGNAESSLLTVLASVLALHRLKAQYPGFIPAGIAGYSVGQWTALYAAEMINLQQLLALVSRRAVLMDACIAEGEPSRMLAVIGLLETDVRRVCEIVNERGYLLEITNENAPGQFTLGGTLKALESAEELFLPKRPKRMVRLPVAGAWHSSQLQPAVMPLKSLLLREILSPPICPIIDNTTGDWLPTDRTELCDALSRQVAAPVRWSRGIKTLETRGVRDVIEVGYGDVLTKFGFFISRSMRHAALFPSPRGPAIQQLVP